MSRVVCPLCKISSSILIDVKEGNIKCTQCGTVIESRFIDETSEYRQFAVDHGVKNKTRTSFAGKDGSQLGTSCTNRDRNNISMRILKETSDTKLKEACKKIRVYASNFELSKEIETFACELRAKMIEKNVAEKKDNTAKDIACIYLATMYEELGYSIEKIISKCGLTSSLNYKKVETVVEDINQYGSQNSDHPCDSPIITEVFGRSIQKFINSSTCVVRICKDIGLKPYFYNLARDVCKLLRFEEGSKPESIAGAVIVYMMERLPRKSEYPDVSKVAEAACVKLNTIKDKMDSIESKIDEIRKLPSYKEFERIVNKRT